MERGGAGIVGPRESVREAVMAPQRTQNSLSSLTRISSSHCWLSQALCQGLHVLSSPRLSNSLRRRALSPLSDEGPVAQRGKGLAQESSDLSDSSRIGTEVSQTPKPVLPISMRPQKSTGYSLGWSLGFHTRPLAPHTSQRLLGQQQGLPISFQLLPTGFELHQLPLHLEQAALQGFLLQAAARAIPQAWGLSLSGPRRPWILGRG